MKCHVHVKEKKKFNRKDNEVLSIGINPMLFVTYKLVLKVLKKVMLLNQSRAGQRPARNWFLEITFVCDVSMFVCVCVRPEAINN